MKAASFEVKDYERKDFARAEKLGISIDLYEEELSEKNVHLTKGCKAVTTLGFSVIKRDLMKQLADNGVKYLATRTIGFDHFDLAAAKEFGIRVSNARYEPYNVADFAVMLMLMLLRKAKISVCRALVNDFSLDGMGGREMRSLTVGIVGAGRIGKIVARNLSGFGCHILAFDPYAKQESIPEAKLVDFDTLLAESDIVTLHAPWTKENKHMFRAETFAKMKRGALIVNTARGELVCTNDLIDALESGQIGGAGIDTLEEETNIAHVDLGTSIVKRRELFYLKQFPNVILTSHYAYFTEEATSAMVQCALNSFVLFESRKENPYEIK